MLFRSVFADHYVTSNFSVPVFVQKKEFEDAAKVFLNEFADVPNVCKYFQTSWKKIGNLWADFGRCFKHGESDTNNLI